MLRLFEAPDEWAEARQRIDVFKFYQGQTLTVATPGDGPNRYDAFVRVDALARAAALGHPHRARSRRRRRSGPAPTMTAG